MTDAALNNPNLLTNYPLKDLANALGARIIEEANLPASPEFNNKSINLGTMFIIQAIDQRLNASPSAEVLGVEAEVFKALNIASQAGASLKASTSKHLISLFKNIGKLNKT
jgi:hypothetical protein